MYDDVTEAPSQDITEAPQNEAFYDFFLNTPGFDSGWYPFGWFPFFGYAEMDLDQDGVPEYLLATDEDAMMEGEPSGLILCHWDEVSGMLEELSYLPVDRNYPEVELLNGCWIKTYIIGTGGYVEECYTTLHEGFTEQTVCIQDPDAGSETYWYICDQITRETWEQLIERFGGNGPGLDSVPIEWTVRP